MGGPRGRLSSIIHAIVDGNDLDPAFVITVAVNTVVIVISALLLAWLTPLPWLLIAMVAIVAWIVWQIRSAFGLKRRSGRRRRGGL